MAGDMVMTAVPELLDSYAAKATGVAGALARQADDLAQAVDRFTRTTDRSAFPGPLPDATRYRALARGVADLGERAGITAAAVRTADTTPRVDMVIMSQAAYVDARAKVAPPQPAPAPPSPGTRPTTVDGWKRAAFERIGIDRSRWDPHAGMRANDAAIRAIWDRYGELYLSDPAHLQWAGMAKLGGATVYAGMMDLQTMAELPDEERSAALRDWVSRLIPAVPSPIAGRLAEALAGASADQLTSFVALFQRMQQAIAEDLLWQHEVYQGGGLLAMLPHVVTGKLDAEVFRAWVDIASGRQERVSRGNRMLLKQEQQVILPPFYDELRSTPAGAAFAEIITLTTESPIPRGRAYRDVMRSSLPSMPLVTNEVPFPRSLIPGPLGRVQGNIADKDDRWEWITKDMWPAYERLLRRDPDEMEQLMRTPVVELAESRRMVPLTYER